jgi:tRNA A-37 threonylcarbamoyl transferase component Bud32
MICNRESFRKKSDHPGLAKKKTETEPKKKSSIDIKKKPGLGKHKRILSNEIFFPLPNPVAAKNLILPETGGSESMKQNILLNNFHSGSGKNLAKKVETTTGLKLSESTKIEKKEHRRVQSNIIDGSQAYSTNQSKLKIKRDPIELAQKYADKFLKFRNQFRELTFKKQKNPTDLSLEKKKAGQGNEEKNLKKKKKKSTVVNIDPSSTMGKSAVVKSTKDKVKKEVKKQVITAVGKGGLHSTGLVKHKRVFSSDEQTLMFFSKFKLKIPSKTDNEVDPNNREEDNPPSAKHLIAKPVDAKKGIAAQHRLLQNWNLNLKAKKYILSENKKTKVSASKRTTPLQVVSKGMEKKDRTDLVVENYSAVSNSKPASQTKKCHKKNAVSLPYSNPTNKFIENLNLPISMNKKGITMTPDVSRPNSPKGPKPSSSKMEDFNNRGGVEDKNVSLISEVNVNDEIDQECNYEFNNLLYSKNRDDSVDGDDGDSDGSVRKTKNVKVLNFCNLDSRQGSQSQMPSSRAVSRRDIHPTSMVSSAIDHEEKSQGFKCANNSIASNLNSNRPSLSRQIVEAKESKWSNQSSLKKLVPVVDQKMRRNQSGKVFPSSNQASYSENQQRQAEPLAPGRRRIEQKLSPAMEKEEKEEVFRTKNEVPLVLHQLMLINQIKEFYRTHSTSQDVATILEFYQFNKMIGEGSFGKVYSAVSVLTGKDVAIKCFDKAKIQTDSAKQKVFQEVKILNMLDHPNISRLLEVFENKKYIFFVIEFAKEGDILSLLKAKGPLSEDIARFIVIQVVHGLKHCHSRDILHRDIKLDNVLLSENYIAKICDFGISRIVKKGEVIHEQCGTPAYIAPEVISGKGYSGFQADIWNLGIMIYAMVTGTVPFKSNSIEELNTLIKRGQYTYPGHSKVSPMLRDLIGKTLCLDPAQRITVDGLIEHPWFHDPMIEALTARIKKAEFETNKEYIMNKLTALGIPESAVERVVREKTLNHINCCYQLYKYN